MTILLLRHGKTAGNLRGEYIGKTDQPLAPQGVQALRSAREAGRFCPQRVVTSPLLRCRQTAQLLFAGVPLEVEPLLAECDFGDFEGKNYDQLRNLPAYQQWLQSGGELPFPGGEGRAQFSRRCRQGFARWVESWLAEGVSRGAFVIHGGSIMAILSEFGRPQKPFYDWQAANGQGYVAEIDPARWEREKALQVLRRMGGTDDRLG